MAPQSLENTTAKLTVSCQSSVKEVSGERVQQKQLPQEIKRLLRANKKSIARMLYLC